jgi:hypothetical protein
MKKDCFPGPEPQSLPNPPPAYDAQFFNLNFNLSY